ncbi:unnamed protein product [Symbiodinium sp. CCMP2592]|nr:unnamed protein product [Symbiodinium sp. CCMP2592]
MLVLGLCADGSAEMTSTSRISSGGDDVEVYQSFSGAKETQGFYTSSSDIELGYDEFNGGNQVVGLMFRGLDLPSKATITSAHVSFTVNDVGSCCSGSFTVRGRVAYDSGLFDGPDISRLELNRIWTYETVPTRTKHSPMAHSSVGSTVEYSGFEGPLQDLMDYGWTRSVLVLFGDASSSESSESREYEAYDGSPNQAPQLTVKWCTTTTTTLLSLSPKQAVPCNFDREDEGACRWDKGQWTWRSGPTPSEYTGPVQAAAGRGYFYTEASTNRDTTFTMLGPQFAALSDWELAFEVSTYGEDIGSIKLEYMDEYDSSYTVLWTYDTKLILGYWMSFTVTVPGTAVRLRFRGVTGSGSKGDIGIDEIKVITSFCDEVTCTAPAVKIDLAPFQAYTPGNEASCCTQTVMCSSFQCPAGKLPVPNSAVTAGSTEAECCDLACSAFSRASQCPTDYILKAHPDRIGGSSVASCCDVMCSRFSCPNSYFSIAAASTTRGNTLASIHYARKSGASDHQWFHPDGWDSNYCRVPDPAIAWLVDAAMLIELCQAALSAQVEF